MKIAVFTIVGSKLIDVIPVHPVRFTDVHVLGRVGTDVSDAQFVRLTAVTLVPSSAKLVSPVGNVGSVVSDVQPDKLRTKVPDGNPPIVVSPAPARVSVVGNPEHPVRFSDVHVAGRVRNDVSDAQFVRFSDVHVVGRLSI